MHVKNREVVWLDANEMYLIFWLFVSIHLKYIKKYVSIILKMVLDEITI